MLQSLFSLWHLQARTTSYAFFKILCIQNLLPARHWANASIRCLLCLFALSILSLPAQAQSLPTGEYYNLTKAGNSLYFTATNADNKPCLWKTDGTRTGTTLVKEINAQRLTYVNGTLYFTGDGGMINEYEYYYTLWKSDGTQAGTVKIKDVPLIGPDRQQDGKLSRLPIQLLSTDNLLYFTSHNSIHEFELWRSDGTIEGTFKVKAVNLYYEYEVVREFTSVPVGNILYFSDEFSLYKTDGTEAGTTLVKFADDNRISAKANVNGTLYFTIYDTDSQDQLWKSDGTPAGTVLVKNNLTIERYNYGAIDPYKWPYTNNTLFFVARNSTNDYGRELWKSDGTEAGTQLVKDINSVQNPSLPDSPGESEPHSLIALNGTLYFTAYDGIHGKELWKSDGTEAGTLLVKDIHPDTAPYSDYPGLLTPLNNTLFFSANDSIHGYELWKSDGTEAGTLLVKDIYPGSASTVISNLTQLNDNLYFITRQEVNGPSQLWKSDGTEAGTVDIFATPASTLSKEWDKTFGGNSADELSLTIATSDNGYLLAGYSYSGISGDKSQASKGNADYWIVKTDVAGNKLWDKNFGTANNDVLTTAIQTSDGGYLLGGYTNAGQGEDKSEPSRGGNDYWIVKTDASGNKLWDKRYGGTDADVLRSIIPLSDGNYLLAGMSNSEQGGDKSQNSKTWNGGNAAPNDSDPWLVKINSNGVKLWDKTLGSYDDENFGAVVATADGGYFVATTLWTPLVELIYRYEKVDSNGNEQWSGGAIGGGDSFSDPNANILTSAIQTQDGGYMVAGYSNAKAGNNKTENSKGGYDYWVVKLNSSGVKQWDKTVGGSSSDELSQVIQLSDGGYVLSGTSYSPISGDKTENSAGADYWLVKLDAGGNKLWDKTFGGSGEDKLKSLLQTIDRGYLLSGTSNSPISGAKSEANRGATDYWILKTMGEQLPPVACSATGSILREYWANVMGVEVTTIPFSTPPTSSAFLSSFEAPTNAGNNYGQRIRGYICVPHNGTYTFYIAGDDNCELYLSMDDDPAHKTRIAHISGNNRWTLPQQWTKFPNQKSVAINLVAGKKYYIEALHKEGLYSDNLAVGWQTSSAAPITVIPGSALSPYVPKGEGKISREYWAIVTGSLVGDIPLNTIPAMVDELTIFETATNSANNYGQRIRGYLHPEVSGNYRFYIAGDDRCELWLSSEEDPEKKAKIASVPYFTWSREWNKYSSQKTGEIYLVAGRKYYIEALHKEGLYSDNLAVGWTLPGQTAVSVITGNYLSPFLPIASIARMGVEENPAGKLSIYPNPFADKLTLTSLQAGKHSISIVDNLGRVVYQTSTEATHAETTLGLAHLKSGVYVIKVAAANGITQVLRVVKK